MKKFIVLYSHVRDAQAHFIDSAEAFENMTVEEINAMDEDAIQNRIDENSDIYNGWRDCEAYVAYEVTAEDEQEALNMISPFKFEQNNMKIYEVK